MLLAIDPGDKHVGLAWGELGGDVHTEEKDADIAVIVIDSMLNRWQRVGHPVEVVIESFVLFHGQDNKKSWNPMLTSEMIGQIKLLCRQKGIRISEQPASIQKPMRGQLRGRAIAMVGKGPHERSAELHYWYRRLRGKSKT
jgi:hypothetical protein